LRNRLSDSSIDGLKAWEYGKLVNFIGDFRGLKVLDVGPGDSTFCLFLARKGASVATIDYPQPMAPDKEGFRERCRQNNVATTCGTMLRLPYKDEKFDLVLCISTIEHLDITPDWEPIPYQDFISLTKRALLEMGRVLKKGGYLYLTSDAYEPERQKTDNWSLGAIYKGIGAAYRIHDIEEVFVNALEQAGLALVNGHDYSPSLLDDSQRSNYRGRYFTTFCVLAQK
jgi:ubiquinone/menaquinone biosynthesis C-methylase UbiE